MSRTVGTRALTVLMGVLLAAGIAVATPTVAHAAKSQCNNVTAMCMWHNQNYGGTFFAPAASDSDLGDDGDEAHSVWNHTGVAWVLYDDANYQDRHYCIRAGVSHPDIGAAPYRFGDKITSVRRLGSNGCGSIPQIAQG